MTTTQPSQFDMIPNQVDCIIIGTGLTNSILAAAFSRIGKSVLHIDKNNYYGGEWASFTLQQLADLVNHKESNVPEELINKSRMFCVDLCPKLLFSTGSMVQLLIKSNVTRYHDFKNNIRILSLVDKERNQEHEIHVIPCQRSDVFTSPILSDLIDKRKLMKFIQLCIEYNPDNDDDTNSEISSKADIPIEEFLSEKGLNKIIRGYLIDSIAMTEPNETTRVACKNIKNFMIATQRYGKSPFLFPMYGCGEFPQSFCRLSAVFGGTYCLNTKVSDIKTLHENVDLTSESKFEVTLENESKDTIKSNILIIDHTSAIDLKQSVQDLNENLSKALSANLKCDKLSRAILITKTSIVQPNEEELLSFMRIPADSSNNNVTHLLEFNSTVMVCPTGINLIYLWTKSSKESAKDDLKPIVDRILMDKNAGDNTNNSNSILWEYYYHQPTKTKSSLPQPDRSQSLTNFYITSPPCDDIDYNSCIKEAEQIFNELCPGEEFLPRAPDPDEIKIE